MGSPVVHFEIHGSDRKKLKGFYEELFGWKINDANPLGYGIVDTEAEGDDGRKLGIGGGLTKDDDAPRVLIYVAVDDPEETLDRIEEMGGEVITPVTSIPGMVTYAVFEDPQGNHIGLVKSG